MAEGDAVCDARVEELELAITMVEGLRDGLLPRDPTRQTFAVLITELRQRINDVRHQQMLERNRGKPAPGSEHMGPGSSNLGERS